MPNKNTTKKIKIFYHKSDMDGLTSAALIKYYYIYEYEKAAAMSFCGYEYGDDTTHLLDDVSEYDIVYVVDICFHPFSEMIRLAKLANVIWIDHHYGAILEYKKEKKKLPKNFKCHLGDKKNSKSACELVWDYLFKGKVPQTIENISLMDTWHHNEDNDIISFHFGAEAHLPDIYSVKWNKFIEGDTEFYNEMQTDGRLLWSYVLRQRLKNAEESAFEIEFEGIPTIVLNTSDRGSHQFGRVYKPEKHGLMMVFNRKDGHWKFSIYTTSDKIDCSAIAKKYGGGGHLKAAGFEIHGDKLPFSLENTNGKN